MQSISQFMAMLFCYSYSLWAASTSSGNVYFLHDEGFVLPTYISKFHAISNTVK